MLNLEQKKIPRGLWDVKHTIGSLPDSREKCSMVGIGREVYIYGGYGRQLFEDLRILHCSGQYWQWELYKPENYLSGKNLTSTQMLLRTSPGLRYGCTMNRYKQFLVVFGGGGPYVQSIKTRQCFSDVRYFDTLEKMWWKDQRGLKGSYVPIKRLHHASDILGCILVS